MDDFYSCTADDSTTLVTSGATELLVTYQYEIETTSDATLEVAMEQVQASMLQSVAEQSGLVDCAGVEPSGPWRRRLSGAGVGETYELGNEPIESRGGDGAHHVGHRRRPARQRQLRAGGRGSTSIVGLSSLPADTVTGVLCRADAIEVATTRVDMSSDPFNTNEREVDPEMAGAVVINQELEDDGNEVVGVADSGIELEDSSGAGADTDVILASTRIDGKVNIVKVAPRSMNNVVAEQIEGESGSSVDSNDDLDLAFNFISTQSLPMERSSHTSHNPLTAPDVFKLRSNLASGSQNSAQSTTNTSNEPAEDLPVVPATEVQQTRFTRKCTVIQGQMSVYSSAQTEGDASYENLEGRIVQALSYEVNHNMNAFTNDVVLAVRMHDDSPLPDPIEASPGFVTVAPIKNGLSSNENTAGTSFTTPMAILVFMGCLLLALVALFVHTSKPRKRTRLHKEEIIRMDCDSYGMSTCYDDEVEMDVKKFMKSHNEDDDDYSVGQFSVSTAKEQSVYYSPRRMMKSIKKSVTPERKEAEGYVGPAPIQSAIMGLFTARPRPVSPDLHSEVELDVASVYDCDVTYNCDGTERNGGAAGDGGANLVADIHAPIPGQEKPKKQKQVTGRSSYLGGIFSSSKGRSTHGTQKQQQPGKVDTDAFMSMDSTNANANAAVSARVLPPTTPTCREHEEVESKYLVPVTTNEDRIILMSGDNESDQEEGRNSLSKKFSRFFKRGKPAPHGDDELYVQEIHEIREIYSNDIANDDKASRTPSATPTDAHTMPRTPSSVLQRPVDMYKSPSALSNSRTRSKLSVVTEDRAHLLNETKRSDDNDAATPRKESNGCMVELGEDDGSVVIDCVGPLCDLTWAEWFRARGW